MIARRLSALAAIACLLWAAAVADGATLSTPRLTGIGRHTARVAVNVEPQGTAGTVAFEYDVTPDFTSALEVPPQDVTGVATVEGLLPPPPQAAPAPPPLPLSAGTVYWVRARYVETLTAAVTVGPAMSFRTGDVRSGETIRHEEGLALTAANSADADIQWFIRTLDRSKTTCSQTAAAVTPGSNGVPAGSRSQLSTVTNSSGEARCLSMTIVGSGQCDAMLAAYNGSFNPAMPLQNYLTDSGTSTGGSVPQARVAGVSVRLEPGASVAVVLREMSPLSCNGINGRLDVDYSLDGFTPAPPQAQATDVGSDVATITHLPVFGIGGEPMQARVEVTPRGGAARTIDAGRPYPMQLPPTASVRLDGLTPATTYDARVIYRVGGADIVSTPVAFTTAAATAGSTNPIPPPVTAPPVLDTVAPTGVVVSRTVRWTPIGNATRVRFRCPSTETRCLFVATLRPARRVANPTIWPTQRFAVAGGQSVVRVVPFTLLQRRVLHETTPARLVLIVRALDAAGNAATSRTPITLVP